MSKPQLVSTLDIKPGELYLVYSHISGGDRADWRGQWQLGEVLCTESPGWLRGYVDVDSVGTSGGTAYRGRAYARLIEFDRTVEVTVTRLVRTGSDDEPWKFVEFSGRQTLRPFDASWMTHRRTALSGKISWHEKQADMYQQQLHLLNAAIQLQARNALAMLEQGDAHVTPTT